uniref:Interleukin-7 n=1 Tax=Gasterosteus aculeatus aculeatus TaxID=481459 RepID=A0AAQ4P248_GASAC
TRGGSALNSSWIQPLLCISLLSLLLLPLSLSCHSQSRRKELREDYKTVVETDINNANENIANLLQNTSCPALKHKLHNCRVSTDRDFVSSLHLLSCKMKKLSVSHTDKLVRSLLNSLGCHCPVEKPTREPTVRLTKRTATRRRRRNQQKTRRETKKLCKSKAILSAMTRCYQMLNSMQMAS